MNVGQILKKARADKGLTLDNLQQSTKIQKRYLIAIEEENFSALPGDFYVRAFIKQYAEAVDLDANELLKKLDEQLGNTHEDEESKDDKATTRTQKRQQLKSNEEPNHLENITRYLPTIIIVIVVLAILGSIYFVTLGNKSKSSATSDNSSSKVAVTSDVTSSSKSSSSSSSSSSKSSSSSASSKKASSSKKSKQEISSTATSGSTFTYSLKNGATKNKVKLTAGSSSAWIAVYSNGTQVWQGTLTSNNSHTLTLPENTTTIKISLGNSKATTVKINGKDFNFLEQDSSTTVRTLVLDVQ